MKKDPRVYLAHILECAEKIERYTKGGKHEFLNNTMTQDAVVRNFEIIGEAAKRVPAAFTLVFLFKGRTLTGRSSNEDQKVVRLYRLLGCRLEFPERHFHERVAWLIGRASRQAAAFV